MDDTRFDALTRSLATPSRRRLLRALVTTLSGAGLAAGTDQAVPAHDLAATCKKRKDKAKRKKCLKKAKAHNAAHKRPGCVPQDPATVCAAGCGTRSNNCGQPVVCACPTGQACLSNGSCGRACTAGMAPFCPGECACPFGPSTEGPSYCVPTGSTCEQAPQSCSSTAECPDDHYCLETAACGPGNSKANRCVPLCTA